jgi:hypothetical protein
MAWESHTYTEHTESAVPMLGTRVTMGMYVEKEREDPTKTNGTIKYNRKDWQQAVAPHSSEKSSIVMLVAYCLRIDWDDIRQCEITGRKTVEVITIVDHYCIVLSVLVCTRIVPA